MSDTKPEDAKHGRDVTEQDVKHVFIVNPAAGQKSRAVEVADTAARLMQKRGEPHVVHVTEHSGHATELLRDMAAKGDPLRIYVYGGDGTLNEAATALVNAPHCALAHCPSGTGNDFVRTAAAPECRSLFSDIESLVDGQVVPIDAIIADDRVAMNSLTCGLDSWVAYYANHYKTWPLVGRKFSYDIALLKSFFYKIKNAFELIVDDGEHIPMRDYLFVALMNGRFYGNGYQPAPRAVLDDGMLDLVMVDSVNRRTILKLLKPYRLGTAEDVSDAIHSRRVRSVEIVGREPFMLGLDGQIYNVGSVRCKVAPGALRIIIPQAQQGFPAPRRPMEESL